MSSLEEEGFTTMHRLMVTLAGRIGFFTAALLLGALTAQAAEKVTYNSDWLFYGRDLGWFTALDKGFFREVGLDVKIVRGFGSGKTVKTVAGGRNDYANSDTGVIIQARAKGMKLKAIGMFHDKSLHAIYTTADKGIRSLKDLEGRTIGVGKGSAPHQMFPALASANGVDPEKIKWLYMAFTVTIPSVISGKIDSTLAFNTLESLFTNKSRMAGKKPVILLYADYGVDPYSSAFMTTDDRIARKPDEVRRFVHAMYKGIAYAVEHPEEAADLFIKGEYNPTSSRKAILAVWDTVMDHLLTPTAMKRGIGYQSRKKMERTRDLMMKFGGVKVKVPLDEIYTNRFLPKLFPKRSN